MGQFSWIYSDTNKPMLDDVPHNSYLLIPHEFQVEFGSHHIKETCYDGYGRMGGYDIYDLVAYWNKDFIYNNPDFTTKALGNKVCETEWYEVFCRAKEYNKFEDFKRFIEQYGVELRLIGIDIACYDEDNESLEYPIKIVESNNLLFNQAYPSESDPNQGWGYDEDEENDDYWHEED